MLKRANKNPTEKLLFNKYFPPFRWEFSIFFGILLGVQTSTTWKISKAFPYPLGTYARVNDTMILPFPKVGSFETLVSRLLPQGISNHSQLFWSILPGGWIRILHLHGLSLHCIFFSNKQRCYDVMLQEAPSDWNSVMFCCFTLFDFL